MARRVYKNDFDDLDQLTIKCKLQYSDTCWHIQPAKITKYMVHRKVRLKNQVICDQTYVSKAAIINEEKIFIWLINCSVWGELSLKNS